MHSHDSDNPADFSDIDMKTDNELIAEFMGAEEWVFSEGQKGHSFWDRDKDGRRGWFPDGCTNKLPGEFKYDTSWDWLMSVVNAIESIEEPISLNPERGTWWPYWIKRGKTSIEIYSGDKILFGVGGNSLQSTHKAVVQFIKWHNEQKQ